MTPTLADTVSGCQVDVDRRREEPCGRVGEWVTSSIPSGCGTRMMNFVAAHAGDESLRAAVQRDRDAVGDLDEKLVTDVVAERVVDGLEPIQCLRPDADAGAWIFERLGEPVEVWARFPAARSVGRAAPGGASVLRAGAGRSRLRTSAACRRARRRRRG